VRSAERPELSEREAGGEKEMPFANYPNPTLPAHIVEVLFKGLIILNPNDDGTCTVGMHRTSDDHFLIIEIRAKRPGGGDVLVARRAGLLQNMLTIRASNPGPGPRVSAFRPGASAGVSLNRQTSSDTRDLRFAIDLLHPIEFYGPNSILMDLQKATPGIQIFDGIFVAIDVTDDNEIEIKRARGASNVMPLDRIAAVTGALIAPPAGSVILDWNDGTSLTLPRPVGGGDGQDPAGTSYRVSVRNEPVEIDFTLHDELESYYDLVKKLDGSSVPLNEQFSLLINLHPHGIGTVSTDRIPCMPILLDGTP
jgi:hypothetical protein